MNEPSDYITLIREYFRSGSLQPFAKNQQVVSRNSAVKQAYYISSGYVRIYTENARKEQYTQTIYGPGDVFPLTWMSKLQVTYATYETMTPAEIYCRPLTKLTKDLVHQEGLAYGMLQQVIEQYRLFALRVDNLEYKYASERLAYRLILLANRFGEHNGKHLTIVPPMTHQLLGSSLNLSRESISREMEKLLRKDLVRYNAKRQIILTDIQALSEQMHVPLQQGLS